MEVEWVGTEWTMGSWCVVGSNKGQTKVGDERVVSQSRQAMVAV